MWRRRWAARCRSLAVARGDEVKSGQKLFELERRSEVDAARQASNDLEQAKANLALSETTLVRREQLRSDQGVISAEELDQARAQRDTDQAQAAAKPPRSPRPTGRSNKRNNSRPTNAFVQDTLYRVGEWVAAGNPVVQLLPPTNLKVRFFVPETVLPKIKPGQTVQVTIRRRPTRLFGDGQLHFDAGRVHAAGDLQPGKPRETGLHDRGEIFSGRRRRPPSRPAGGCGVEMKRSNDST